MARLIIFGWNVYGFVLLGLWFLALGHLLTGHGPLRRRWLVSGVRCMRALAWPLLAVTARGRRYLRAATNLEL